MKFQVNIENIQNVDEIPNYWSIEDYIKLLDLFGFPDAQSKNETELRELLFMAISDYEPNEAAAILLKYKLENDLNEGQIDQISNEMLIDKVCEEYPVIALHSRLYSCNQLAYKAFNGKFPNAKASIIKVKIEGEDDTKITKALMLKILNAGLSDSSLIKRLFDEPMTTSAEFPDAENILWKLNTTDNKNFEIVTSEYWLDRESFVANEFVGEYLIEE